MSITVILDPLDDPPHVSEDSSGFRVERVALVFGLSGTNIDKIRQAATARALPARGTPLQGFPGVTLAERSATLIDADKARVRLSYRKLTQQEVATEDDQPGLVSVRYDSRLLTERVTTDINGRPMVNRFVGRKTIILNGELSEDIGTTFAATLVEAEQQVPQLIAEAVYNSEQNPAPFLVDMNGSVNVRPWGGQPALSWLLAVGPTEYTGRFWQTVYQFIYRPDTWRFTHTIQINGIVPEAATEGNGIAEFETIRRRDFGDLGFDLRQYRP